MGPDPGHQQRLEPQPGAIDARIRRRSVKPRRQNLPASHPLAKRKRIDLFYKELKNTELSRQSFWGLYFVNYFIWAMLGFILFIPFLPLLRTLPDPPTWLIIIGPFIPPLFMTWGWLVWLRNRREKYNYEAFHYNQALAREVIHLSHEERLQLSELWRGCSPQIQRDQHALHERFAGQLMR